LHQDLTPAQASTETTKGRAMGAASNLKRKEKGCAMDAASNLKRKEKGRAMDAAFDHFEAILGGPP
jgi:hypothetical protein